MFSTMSFLTWMIYRRFYITILLGFWFEIWLVYILNNLLSGYFVQYIGHYPAHVYRNLIIIPFYIYAARIYVLLVKEQGFKLRPWLTGTVWVSLSIIADFSLWHFVFDFSWNYLINQFALWNGRLYSLELLALLVSVPVMDRYFRRYYRYRS